MIKTLLLFLLQVFSFFMFSQNIHKYDLLITEIMFDPTPKVELLAEEYIEIYNNSKSPIKLSELHIGVGIKSIPLNDFILKPDSFYIITDKEIPALKNTGDSLRILSTKTIIHKVNFKPSMHSSEFKKEGGWSLELIDFSKPCFIKENWISCKDETGGTPGYENSQSIKIVPPAVKITSYFPISDSILKVNFNIPVDTIESNYFFNSSTIPITKLDSLSIDSITITSIKTCFPVEFEKQTIKYGLPHRPDSGKLIINEILFNPDAFGSDFVEIFNTSSHPINLSNLYFCKRDKYGELEDLFKVCNIPKLLLPKEFIVFCEDVLWLKEAFPNSKNIHQIELPAMNNKGGSLVLTNKVGDILDEINYSENWHYAELNDLENISLEKIIPNGENSHNNWNSATSLENFATPGYKNSNMHYTGQTNSYFSLPYEIITPNADGYRDFLILNYTFLKPAWTGQIDVLNYSGETIHSFTQNTLFGLKGTIIWNGYLSDNLKIPAGIYALWINAYNLKNNQRIKQKLTFYVNRRL